MLARMALSTVSRGITAHRLSKNVTFYVNELTSPGAASPTSVDPKPLLLMLPWLGSRPQAVAKYCEIYFRTGFDILVVESEVRPTHIIDLLTLVTLYLWKQINPTTYFIVLNIVWF